ncbi:hypothetical protein, partial [Endozoicomonas sp. ONNA1]
MARPSDIPPAKVAIIVILSESGAGLTSHQLQPRSFKMDNKDIRNNKDIRHNKDIRAEMKEMRAEIRS